MAFTLRIQSLILLVLAAPSAGAVEIETIYDVPFGKLLGRPEILYSSVLRQMRTGRFKDIGKDALTFEEACPGEEPIYEFAIDIIEESTLDEM